MTIAGPYPEKYYGKHILQYGTLHVDSKNHLKSKASLRQITGADM